MNQLTEAAMPDLTPPAKSNFMPYTPKAYTKGSFGGYVFGQGEGVIPVYGINGGMFYLDEKIKS